MSHSIMKVAAVQMCSSSSMSDNLRMAESWIAKASQLNVAMVVLPESFALMEKYEGQKLEYLESADLQEAFAAYEGQSATLEPRYHSLRDWLQAMAVRYQVCLVGGTIAERSQEPQRTYARTYVFDKKGQELARYDKIHLFDVEVAQAESYCESAYTMAGDELSTFELNGFRCGLSVCYDLRFPEMYRQYSAQGVELILAPSAFTQKTGAAHWELLLKARAVENVSFVIAPNQSGCHDNKRTTYGHSMVVDPWGNSLAQLEEGTGLVVAELNKQQLESIRAQFPVLQHRRV